MSEGRDIAVHPARRVAAGRGLKARRLVRIGKIELARRSDPAVLVHPMLLVAVGLVTPIAGEYPTFFWVVAALLVPLALVRWHQVRNFDRLYDANPDRTNMQFRAGTMLVAGIWGVFAAFPIWVYGVQGPTVIVLICTAGILAGGVVSQCVDLRGCWYFMVLTGAPFIVMSFVDGTPSGIGLGAVSLIYCLVMTIEALHLNRAYWQSVMTAEELRVANETKSRFLASVSHELRTPLTGVVGHLQLLMHGSVREDQRRSLLSAQNSAEALLRVINDLLDVSKVEAGRLELVDERFDVENILRGAIDTVAPRAQRKGLRLMREIAADVPRYVQGDAGRLRQVLINLLGNAIKFTETGCVTASVAWSAERQGETALLFRVQDTGIGIEADRQLVIFEPFTQADATVSRKYGGTGLGLSICAQLVRMMGGHIEVRSTVGSGSCFEFVVWMRNADQEAEPPRKSPDDTTTEMVQSSLAPLRVLLVEDNPEIGHAVSKLLRRRGHTVNHVTDGVHAVATCETEGSEYDIALMDINMPGMDGVEATRAIRRLESEGRERLPIIALTADALPNNRLRCREAGMDAFATKPVQIDDLCSLMDRLTSNAGWAPTPSGTP